MAEMTIRLRINPETGKKDIVISLSGDDDSLPHEHEQQHRRLVEKLIAGGLLDHGEAGKLVVERVEEENESPGKMEKQNEQPQRQQLSEGG